MKEVLIAGDTLDNAYTVAGYPASDGWTLHFRLIPHVEGPDPIELVTTAYGDSYRLQYGPSATMDWAPGEYALKRWVEKVGARYSVDTDPELPVQVTIQADPATALSYDGRSSARRNLEAIETFLGGKASGAVQEYEINGRRLVNYKPAELIQLADYFRRQVANEDVAASLASGLGNPRHVYVRFGSTK